MWIQRLLPQDKTPAAKIKRTSYKGVRGEIYQPAAQANGDFIGLSARVDGYFLTMCVPMPCCVCTCIYMRFFFFLVFVVFIGRGVSSCLGISCALAFYFQQISA